MPQLNSYVQVRQALSNYVKENDIKLAKGEFNRLNKYLYNTYVKEGDKSVEQVKENIGTFTSGQYQSIPDLILGAINQTTKEGEGEAREDGTIVRGDNNYWQLSDKDFNMIAERCEGFTDKKIYVKSFAWNGLVELGKLNYNDHWSGVTRFLNEKQHTNQLSDPYIQFLFTEPVLSEDGKYYVMQLVLTHGYSVDEETRSLMNEYGDYEGLIGELPELGQDVEVEEKDKFKTLEETPEEKEKEEKEEREREKALEKYNALQERYKTQSENLKTYLELYKEGLATKEELAEIKEETNNLRKQMNELEKKI